MSKAIWTSMTTSLPISAPVSVITLRQRKLRTISSASCNMNFITHQLRALLYAVSEYRLGYATDASGLELLLSAHSCQIIFVKCELGLERIKSAGEGVGTADHNNSSTSRTVYAASEYRLGHATDALGLILLPSAYSY